jgi:uncharacterized membrane protein YeaQ/YmgE (transglycosylase-associated protein family)
MNDRLQPALWGGVLIGVLSALPLVSAGNCCCCLWVLVGGGLAAYLRQQNSPYQITASEGAIVGLMAGLIGAVIGSVLAIPFQYMAGPMQQQMMERIVNENPDITPELRVWLERATNASGLWIIGFLFAICAYSVFGVLGGLLGVAIFKKNLPPPPPPGTIDVPPASIAAEPPGSF